MPEPGSTEELKAAALTAECEVEASFAQLAHVVNPWRSKPAFAAISRSGKTRATRDIPDHRSRNLHWPVRYLAGPAGEGRRKYIHRAHEWSGCPTTTHRPGTVCRWVFARRKLRRLHTCNLFTL
jgi:hypothetical protein